MVSSGIIIAIRPTNLMSICPRHTPTIGLKRVRRSSNESGVTLVITAIAMFSLLAITVIALDVANLYITADQVQKAADAAALAGAEAFVSSSTTSNPAAVPLSSVCNGANGDADERAQRIAAQNQVPTLPPATVTTSCSLTAPTQNPVITVTVAQSQIPSFFARMFGARLSSVSATALAEAYNPSLDPSNPGLNRPPISVHGVKPWLVSNCNPPCNASPFFFNADYSIANAAGFIGQKWTLQPMTSGDSPSFQGAYVSQYYALDGPAPISCPSNGAVSCSQIGTGPPGLNYHDNIACENTYGFSNGQFVGPGQPFTVDTRSAGNLQARTGPGTTCLIHADTTNPGVGQDIFTDITVGLPISITGGYNNPDTSLRGVTGIHRSDSVVTVPVFNCPAGTCDGTAQLPIVGFLQIAIQDVTSTGYLHVVIVNAAGGDPASTGTPIAGAGSSPVLVRLIH